jgi:hypothetical protein
MDIIVYNIKKYLNNIESKTKKEEKAEIATEMFDYLCKNSEFVNKHEKFKEAVRLKCKELLTYTQEFKGLFETINKTVEILGLDINYDEFKILKDLNHMIPDQDCTIYEYICKDSNNIIIKNDDDFQGFDRSILIDKYTKTNNLQLGKKKIDSTSIDFLMENHKFYELVHSSEEHYFLIPYEMNTFIKKFK